MDAVDFIAIMLTWYSGSISLRTDLFISDNNDQRQPITLSAPNARNVQPITIYAKDKVLDRKAVSDVIAWVAENSEDIDKNLSPEGLLELGKASTPFNPDKSGSIPERYSVITEDSGELTLFDEEGQNIATLPRGASVKVKTDALINDYAEKVADGVAANPPQDPNNIDVSPSYLETITNIADNDRQVVEKGLISQGVKPLSPQQVEAQQSSPLTQLYNAVTATLERKAFLTPDKVPAVAIDQACNNTGFTFHYFGTDGRSQPPYYYILDKDKKHIALGELSKPLGGTDYYLTDKEVESLQNQIAGTPLKAPIASTIPPEQTSRIAGAAARIKKFFTEREKGPDKPGKGPDPETKDPHGNGQEGPGN